MVKMQLLYNMFLILNIVIIYWFLMLLCTPSVQYYLWQFAWPLTDVGKTWYAVCTLRMLHTHLRILIYWQPSRRVFGSFAKFWWDCSIKNSPMFANAPWLPDHEVPRSKITGTVRCALTQVELLAKYIRLYEEMKRMISELVDLVQEDKVADEVFQIYCHGCNKGLQEAPENDKSMHDIIVEQLRRELKEYRSFYKRKSDRFEKTIETLKSYLREWQRIWKDVRDHLVNEYD